MILAPLVPSLEPLPVKVTRALLPPLLLLLLMLTIDTLPPSASSDRPATGNPSIFLVRIPLVFRLGFPSVAAAAAAAAAPACKECSGDIILFTKAKEEGAVCLDGSPPAIFLRRGTGGGANNWLLFFEGGGWCYSLDDCYKRSLRELGSTRVRAGAKQSQTEGVMSNDPRINPDFHNWNLAIFKYCDGGSFTGDRAKPVKYKGSTLYIRGRRILSYAMRYLMAKGMSRANQIVISGSSAGAITTLIHCHSLKRSVLPKNAAVKCLVDAAVFPDTPDSKGSRNMGTLFKRWTAIHNSKASAHPDCLAGKRKDRHYECFMTRDLLRHLSTPIFLIHSNYDPSVNLMLQYNPDRADNGLGKLIRSKCSHRTTSCSKDLVAVMNGVRRSTISIVAPLRRSKFHGVFLYSCFEHGGMINGSLWNSVQVNKWSMRRAVGEWLKSGSKNNDVDLVDGVYPCNACSYSAYSPYPCECAAS